MTESELYRQGTEVRRKLMGAATADGMAASVYDDTTIRRCRSSVIMRARQYSAWRGRAPVLISRPGH